MKCEDNMNTMICLGPGSFRPLHQSLAINFRLVLGYFVLLCQSVILHGAMISS